LLAYLWIALGGALGSVARYAGSNLVASWWGEAFPWGTILVNVTGSFVIGLFSALTGPDGPAPASDSLRQFVMIGVCGGYTTFSSFSLQTLTLLRQGHAMAAGANVLISLAACLAAVALGYLCAVALGR